MEGVLLAVLTAGAIGVSSWTLKFSKRLYFKNKGYREQLEKLPQIILEHERLHEDLDNQLSLSQQIDIVQLKNQMMLIHDDACSKGYITPRWKMQFYDIYDMYKKGGGNGFADQLKADIDLL